MKWYHWCIIAFVIALLIMPALLGWITKPAIGWIALPAKHIVEWEYRESDFVKDMDKINFKLIGKGPRGENLYGPK